jgi:hypothetical protein
MSVNGSEDDFMSNRLPMFNVSDPVSYRVMRDAVAAAVVERSFNLWCANAASAHPTQSTITTSPPFLTLT